MVIGGAERPEAAVQPAQDVVGDGGHREVPPVPGRRALQDPRQARVRHAPAQHRRAGERAELSCLESQPAVEQLADASISLTNGHPGAEDKDKRANQEAPGARAQHGQGN